MTTRVYLPATVRRLAAMIDLGSTTPVSGLAFAVTAELVATSAVSPSADQQEELEYLAMLDAARASLRLLTGDPEPARRVVIAADVLDARERGDLDRAVVEVSGSVPWSAVAAVHLDADDAVEVVRAAIGAVDAADLGDLDADFVVGAAEDYELAWYAPSEVRYLVEQLTA